MSSSQQVEDPLAGFAPRRFEHGGREKTVHVAGAGPAVVVMPEMPGISPDVARFARWVRDAGFRVYLPSLFGRDGAVPAVEEGTEVMRRACVSEEFRVFAGGGSSPVADWLRALARTAQAECGGEVGVVGMCFTGNFALLMALDPVVTAPVLAQPSLPLDAPAALEISAGDAEAIAARVERDDLTVLAYRFAGDPFCKAERFAAYQEAFGDRFVARVLPDAAANREGIGARMKPHSVVTAHLIDRAGEPTREALDEILGFFRQRLAG